MEDKMNLKKLVVVQKLFSMTQCDTNPYQNGGIRTEETYGYKCTCVAGYSGTNCENNMIVFQQNSC